MLQNLLLSTSHKNTDSKCIIWFINTNLNFWWKVTVFNFEYKEKVVKPFKDSLMM